MKSIKEKAEEHAPYTREDSWIRTQKCIIAQTSFEAGANYVLDSIENILNANRILGDPFPTVGMRLDIIIDTIKQLKNNQ